MGFFDSINRKTKKSSSYDEARDKYEYDKYHNGESSSHDGVIRGNKGNNENNNKPTGDTKKRHSFRWGSLTKQKNGVKYNRNSSLTLGTGTTLSNDNNKFTSDDEDDDDSFDSEKIKLHFGHGNNDDDDEDEDDDDDDDDDDVINELVTVQDDDESSADGLQELDRATVRLDGIEVYAIVSALTCATSISCFDNFEPTPIDIIMQEYAVFTFLADLCYFGSGALGMMTGLHATLIFSLVTMYGRTALGIDRDDAFNEFFSNTGGARFSGFRSFKVSLYCFMTQLSFLIQKKFVFTPLRPLVLVVTGYLAYNHMYKDSEAVLAAASVIYSAPPAPVEPRRTSKAGSRVSSIISTTSGGTIASKPRRSSVKKSSFSLSTRNFGVDCSARSADDHDLLLTPLDETKED
jgi:hypothetical protein